MDTVISPQNLIVFDSIVAALAVTYYAGYAFYRKRFAVREDRRHRLPNRY